MTGQPGATHPFFRQDLVPAHLIFTLDMPTGPNLFAQFGRQIVFQELADFIAKPQVFFLVFEIHNITP
jgi:hypothetical protein